MMHCACCWRTEACLDGPGKMRYNGPRRAFPPKCKRRSSHDRTGTVPGRHCHAGPLLQPLFPFSRGCALECSDGTVLTGCNIENAAYGLTICAERTAIFKAISEGHRDFKRIVIAGKSEDYCVPCGSCRQVMQEFAPQMEVICLNGKGEAKHFALKELLPYGFDETWL